MKKLTLLVATLMIATFTFAQNSGQWSFGVGTDFTSPNVDANVGYFIMDGLLLNASFNMLMEYETETNGLVNSEKEDGDFNWAVGIRYYVMDNVFLGANMKTETSVTHEDGHEDHEHEIEPDGPGFNFEAGVSLKLGFEDRLWFEPMLVFNMPGFDYGENSQNSLGLGWAFRYTF